MPRRNADHLALKIKHMRIVLQLAEAYAPDAELWAYGSRVKGTSHEGSDLDLVLRCGCSGPEAQGQLSKLQQALRESDLPMRVEIHDWASLEPEFQREVERAYVVIRSQAREG